MNKDSVRASTQKFYSTDELRSLFNSDYPQHFEILHTRFQFYTVIGLADNISAKALPNFRIVLPKHEITYLISSLQKQFPEMLVLKIRKYQYYLNSNHHRIAIPVFTPSKMTQFFLPSKENLAAIPQLIQNPQLIPPGVYVRLQYVNMIRYNPAIFYFNGPPTPPFHRITLILNIPVRKRSLMNPILYQIPYYCMSDCVAGLEDWCIYDLILPEAEDHQILDQIRDKFKDHIRYLGSFLETEYTFFPFIHFEPHRQQPDMKEIHKALQMWITTQFGIQT